MDGRRSRDNTENRCLYTAFTDVVVRAPLLPINVYLELGSHVPTDEPIIRRALAVGSADLFNALERSSPDRSDNATVRGKLLRYITRMSSRPTPYGLFAGVQLAQWGTHTDIVLAPDGPRTRTRPDMQWLCKFVWAVESRPEIRQQLRFVAARNVLVHDGRAILHSQAPTANIAAPDTSVSVRATKAVLKALDVARAPVPYGQLFDELLAVPGATPAKAEQLITELWEQTFLLTDLRPPMTIASPGDYVAKRLEQIPAAQHEHRLIAELLKAMAAWDRTPAEQAPAAYRGLLNLAAQPPVPFEFKYFAQVDMAHRLQGNQISAAVAADAATAAEILLRLTPSPQGLPHIAAYRQSFEYRYGADCQVPLLELLDPDSGLGSPYEQPGGHTHSQQLYNEPLRQRTLREVAIDALRRRLRCVQLDDAMLEAMQTWSPEHANAPASLDIPVFVVAATAEAIDAGEFRVVVGPNVGAVSAGQNLGRFADMLGPQATAALRNIADVEQARDPQALSAELTYLPHSLRSANVAIRPLVRGHEIAFGTVPAAVQQAIPLDELMVGVRNGRFRIRWSRKNVDVLVYTSHMLNSIRAPTICRFLSDVRQDGIAQLNPFYWGAASDFPYLPRVERGRVVLSVAQWRLPCLPADTASAFNRGLDDWRADWQLPRYVYLVAGDNRLLIDLDDCAQVAELYREARRVPQKSPIVLQEALPGPHDAWLPGPGGRYATELVVSVALSHPGDFKKADKQWDSSPPWRLRPAVSRHDQLRPIGSDWLYVKLYCPTARQDEFVVGTLTAFCEGMRSSGLVQTWFFIRYKDPESHIRLRFRGEPDTLTTSVLPQLCSWSRQLVDDGALSRICVDTYEREVTRYGGPGAIEAAEDLFAADSRAAIDLLALSRRTDNAVDRTILSMLNIESLLAAFGLDDRRRIAWYRERVISKSESGDDYRKRKRELCNRVGDPPDTLVGIFSTRTAALEPVRARLEALTAAGALQQPLDRLLISFVHMSCNRLSGPQWPSEQRSLGLLVRTRTALLHVPGQS